MKSAPCKDCKERIVGCHSVCLKYINWDYEHQLERQRIRKIKDREINLLGQKIQTIKKIKTKRNIK